LLGQDVVCGKSSCPIFDKCPRIMMEEATDAAVDRVIDTILEIVNENKRHG
jgi:hypothetical protein